MGWLLGGYPHCSMALSSSLNRHRERQQTSLPRKKIPALPVDDDSDGQKVSFITMKILLYWSTALARKIDGQKRGYRNVLERRDRKNAPPLGLERCLCLKAVGRAVRARGGETEALLRPRRREREI